MLRDSKESNIKNFGRERGQSFFNIIRKKKHVFRNKNIFESINVSKGAPWLYN